MRIAVLGGLNLDILGRPDGSLKLRDSNPGRITFACGGVGHNTAAALRRLGHTPALFTCLGNDVPSRLLETLCREEGLDVRACVRADGPGCVYLCVHEESGDMLLAVNDMRAMERMTADAALEALEQYKPEALVMDTNLNGDVLCAAARAWAERIPVFLDPVSTFKAPRCMTALPYLTAIKPNRMEALDMTGERTVEGAAERLISLGVRYVFISLGAEGVYYADRFTRGICPAVPIGANVPLTGAGDAMFAGLIDGVLRGMDTPSCAENGCREAWLKLTKVKDEQDEAHTL